MRRWFYFLALAGLQYWLIARWGTTVVEFALLRTQLFYPAMGWLPLLQIGGTLGSAVAWALALAAPMAIAALHGIDKDRLSQVPRALLPIVWAGLLLYATGLVLEIFGATSNMRLTPAYSTIAGTTESLGGLVLAIGVLAGETGREVPLRRVLVGFSWAAGVAAVAIVGINWTALATVVRASAEFTNVCTKIAALELNVRAPTPSGFVFDHKGTDPLLSSLSADRGHSEVKGVWWLLRQGVPYFDRKIKSRGADGAYTYERVTLGTDGKMLSVTQVAQSEAPYILVVESESSKPKISLWHFAVKDARTGDLLASASEAFDTQSGQHCPLVPGGLDIAAIVAYTLGAGDQETLAQVEKTKAAIRR